MKHTRQASILRGALGCALLAFAPGAALGAQSKPQDPPPVPAPETQDDKGEDSERDTAPIELPEVDFGNIGAGQDAQARAQEEMIALFGKVERRLRLIDSMLLNASAGEIKALEELGSSGIEELIESVPDAPDGETSEQQDPAKCDSVGGRLSQSSGQSRQVVEEIDSIIQIARQLPSECKSGAPSPGEKPGGSPVDQPQGTRDRSQSPEMPKDMSDQEGKCPDPTNNSDGDKHNHDSDQDADNSPAQQTPSSETGAPPTVTDQSDQWGDLPVHVRDVFRAEGGPGMPARYRDWIDAYYRRLNARSSD